jgi:hypothetical protein
MPQTLRNFGSGPQASLWGLAWGERSERKFCGGLTLQGGAKLKAPVRPEPHPTIAGASPYQSVPSTNQIDARLIQELHLGVAFHSPDFAEHSSSTDHFNPALQFNIVA